MEYPRVEVTIVDENTENSMKREYGEEIYKTIKSYYKNRGVKFIEKRKVVNLENKELLAKNSDKNDNKKYNESNSNVNPEIIPKWVHKVNLAGKSLDTDYVLLFPNNKKVETKYVTVSSYHDEMRTTKKSALLVEEDMNVGTKRIFAAGDSASTKFYINSERYEKGGMHKSINEGIYAAYNLMGIVIYLF